MAKSQLSPTARTLRTLKANGRTCQIVERWNQFGGPHGIRVDLFGFIDVISLDPERGIVGVQCCAGSGHAAHRRKIIEDCNQEAMEWLRCGGKIEIWSWSKRKLKRGSRVLRWMPRMEEITLDHLDGDGDGPLE